MVNAGAVAFPPFVTGHIVTNALSHIGSPEALILRIVLILTALIGPAIFTLTTAVQIGVQDAPPSPRAIGALTAMVKSANSIMQAAVPAFTQRVFQSVLVSGYYDEI
ncbi:Ff.00g016100.m01.CDS01 [Fusarium sp. VM40]|nr:Ff.00g016100.m01.CDS01 [Fusarium sp. VM40]